MRNIVTAITVAWLLAWTSTVYAQPYPSRPVTIVVPQQAGSNSDNVIRPLAAALQESMGQPFIIYNRAGADGIIGVEVAARAKPDGYTLLVASSTTFVTNPGLFKKLTYDPVKDFRSVANIGKTSMMFVTRHDFPVKSISELLAYAKSQGKSLDVAYGSSTARLAISLLTSASGVGFTAIPYKGSPQLLTDLIGGVVQIGVVDVGNGAQHVKGGRVRALAISDSARSPFVPDVPTLSEQFVGVALVSWIGLVAPAGTPDNVVRVLYEEVRRAMERPEVVQRFAAAGTVMALMPPEALDQLIRDDIPKWSALMRTAGIERQ